MKNYLLLLCCLAVLLSGCNGSASGEAARKPTICVLGGTPSTSEILALIPDSIKAGYHFISFNRPGFGGSENQVLTPPLLYQLAEAAGLREHDYGIIGISGGAPLAILLAEHFKLQHCGVISGMVSREAFFAFGDKAITSGIMRTALGEYGEFEAMARQFPNLEEIVRQAGAPSDSVALRACYDEFNFILGEDLFPAGRQHPTPIDWWHGEEDVNVPIESAEAFLTAFQNATLNRIPGADHNIDANAYISKTLTSWR